MDEQLFLAPASQSSSGNRVFQHFHRTVLNEVPEQFVSNYSGSTGSDPVRVWGLKSSVKTEWEAINTNDWFLFYTDSDTYGYGAQVVGTEYNPDLGDAIRAEILNLHENEKKSNWDCLVYFDEPVELEVSGEEIADIFGYGNDYPVRFIRVTAARMSNLENEFETVTEFIYSIRA